MIFLTKEEFKQVWSVARIVITVILCVTFGIGFLVGTFNANDKSYCTYDSVATRMNIGYVIGCEIYRPRWAKPCGTKKIFSITHQPNYRDSYNVVTFEDGTTKVMEIDPKMAGKEIKDCGE